VLASVCRICSEQYKRDSYNVEGMSKLSNSDQIGSVKNCASVIKVV
jgi:hypothetical protein